MITAGHRPDHPTRSRPIPWTTGPGDEIIDGNAASLPQ
jgi:hypothetical protein